MMSCRYRRQVYPMGCLSERFLKEMQKELPEVDKFYGKFNWKGLITDLGKSYYQELALDRVLTTPKHYAYLKIAEGCNRTCSYCAIPISTGHYQSVPMEELEREVRCLVAQGVKELQVIAQDLTYYGFDLYKRYALPELVERLSDIPGVEWIRLHYGYPSHFPYELLRVMISFGASPRASINLALAARAYAFIKRRGYVIPEDIRAVCHDVMCHRIGLSYEAEANNLTPQEVISEILNKVEVP